MDSLLMRWSIVALLAFVSCWGTASLMSITQDDKEGVLYTPGKEIVIWCNVTGYDGATVKWSKDGESYPWPSQNTSDANRITVEGSKLVIERAKREDLGVYKCRIDAPGTHTDIATVLYQPAFARKFHEKSKNLVEGETGKLDCQVEGYPIPSVIWKKGDDVIEPSERIQFLPLYSKDNLTVFPDATLQISPLEFFDRDTYTCEADNGYGKGDAKILLRIKGKLEALWPFIGICLEVIILMAIIFFYEHRRSKKDDEEEVGSPDTPPSPASPESAKGSDVRQRK